MVHSTELSHRTPLRRIAAHLRASSPILLILALLFGVAATASAGIIQVKPPSAKEWQAGASGSFHVLDLELRPVDPWGGPTALNHDPPADAPIPHFTYAGEVWNHPSRQTQYGLELLAAYDANRDARYLAQAERVADHLLGYAVTSRGALFLPYPFAWGPSQPPWYSALAQGKALAFFTRLWERTGADRWRSAADAVFASFLVPPSATEPWVSFVDERGNLWLEEYPGDGIPSQVFNGHITAIFGLSEYNRVFHSPDAERLVRGGLTTVIERGPDFRVIGGVSYYGLRDGVQHKHYHVAHIRMLDTLAAMTGSLKLAALREAFTWDLRVLPRRGTVARWLWVAAGLVLAVALVWRPRGRRGSVPGQVALEPVVADESEERRD